MMSNFIMYLSTEVSPVAARVGLPDTNVHLLPYQTERIQRSVEELGRDLSVLSLHEYPIETSAAGSVCQVGRHDLIVRNLRFKGRMP